METREHEKQMAAAKKKAASDAANKVCRKLNKRKGPMDREKAFQEIKRAKADAAQTAEKDYMRSHPEYSRRKFETWRAGIKAKLRGVAK